MHTFNAVCAGLLASVLLSGCGTTCEATTHTTATAASLLTIVRPDENAVAAPGVAMTAATDAPSLGSLLVIPGDEASPASTAEVLHEYTSASGLQCRRLWIRATSSVRVMCQRDSGNWTLTRALIDTERLERAGAELSRAVSQHEPLAPTTTIHDLAESALAGDSSSQVELRAGESLWRFAARTTGKATHWRLIAQENGIDNPDRVRAGTKLYVPQSLMREL